MRQLVGNLADTDRVRAGLDLGPVATRRSGPSSESR